MLPLLLSAEVIQATALVQLDPLALLLLLLVWKVTWLTDPALSDDGWACLGLLALLCICSNKPYACMQSLGGS